MHLTLTRPFLKPFPTKYSAIPIQRSTHTHAHTGGKFTEVPDRMIVVIFFSAQTLGQKWDEELVGQVGGQILHVTVIITVTISMLLLFGPVMLLCGKFLFFFCDEWMICLIIRLWTPSDQQVCQHWASDTTSRGVSAPEWNFTPHCMRLLHRGGCCGLLHDPSTLRAVWRGLQ